jgi:hypothetical protein
MSRAGKKCPGGKQGSYPTLAAAQDDLVRIQSELRANQSDAKVPERAYDCERCPDWHLTSQPRNSGRVRRAGRYGARRR